jgi:hypothetical protein
MKKALLVLLCLLTTVSFIYSQDKKAFKEALKKEGVAIEQVLKAYTVCKFDDGLRISQVDRIQKDKIKYLVRQTAKGITDKSLTTGKSEDRIFLADNGDLLEGVSRTDGYRVMLDYDQPDYFANLRADRSIPEGFSEDKEILLRWLNFLNSARVDSETKSVQEAVYNGIKVYSINRTTIEKEEIATSLFFDDANKIYVTIYFLTQRPQFRNFKTIEEWKILRDKFLEKYTSCVKENLENPATPK